MRDNCYCNICGVPMYRDRPEHGKNFCSKFCRAVAATPSPKRERDADKKPPRTSGVRPVFDCTPWPTPKHVEYWYAPAHTLRIKGSKNHERLTTKVHA
jgi:hypothetical protein